MPPANSAPTSSPDRIEFKSEISEILNLIVNKFYSDSSIFLRELVTNASDAINRLRLERTHTQNESVNPSHYDIRICVDTEHRTITIADTGIGMSREELVENLGTIAKSGTRDLKNPSLIGNFGVGFYSVFLVAKRVVVETRKTGDAMSHVWTSENDGGFCVQWIDFYEKKHI